MAKWTGLWVAGACAAACGAMIAMAQAPLSKAAEEAGLEQQLRSTPIEPMMAAIKAHYPDDYRRILSDLNDKMNDPNVSTEQMVLYSGERITGFYASKKVDMTNASEESLYAIGKRAAAFVDRLSKENVKACAQFATTGFKPDAGLSDALLTENNRINAMAFAAAKEGSLRKRDPSRGKVSVDDAELWYDAMAKFEPDRQLFARMQDDAAIAKASERDLCRMGRLSWGSALLLPKPVAARVTAYLLSDEE